MPIQLELRVTSGKPICRGNDHYWSVIRDLGKGDAQFTLNEIAQRSNDPKDCSIGDFVNRLVKARYLTIVRFELAHNERGRPYNRNIYKLERRPSDTPILNRDGSLGTQGLGQQQLWTAIRSLPRFDKHELAIASGTTLVDVTVNTARRYAMCLQDAGYLSVIRPGGAAVSRIWRLKPSMNTGRVAPRILRGKVVYDCNKSQVMGNMIATEIAA